MPNVRPGKVQWPLSLNFDEMLSFYKVVFWLLAEVKLQHWGHLRLWSFFLLVPLHPPLQVFTWSTLNPLLQLFTGPTLNPPLKQSQSSCFINGCFTPHQIVPYCPQYINNTHFSVPVMGSFEARLPSLSRQWTLAVNKISSCRFKVTRYGTHSCHNHPFCNARDLHGM